MKKMKKVRKKDVKWVVITDINGGEYIEQTVFIGEQLKIDVPRMSRLGHSLFFYRGGKPVGEVRLGTVLQVVTEFGEVIWQDDEWSKYRMGQYICPECMIVMFNQEVVQTECPMPWCHEELREVWADV